MRLNFCADWIAILREELRRRGYVPPVEDQHVAFRLFDLIRREVPAQPRQVEIAAGFTCPRAYRGVLRDIRRKARYGEDLKPYLSSTTKKLNARDALFDDRGIQHFHLGDRMEPNGAVSRTRPVLLLVRRRAGS